MRLIIGILLLVLCVPYFSAAEGRGEGGVSVSEVSLTSHGPGGFRAHVIVKRAGAVSAGMVDGNNLNPFAREVKLPIRAETRRQIFGLASAILKTRPGKEPIIDRNDIVDITIIVSGSQYHMYVRDLDGVFDIEELNQLDGVLKTIARTAGFSWR